MLSFITHNAWIFLVLFYALSKGARELLKKKALQTNTVIEVLLVYTCVSFLLVLPTVGMSLSITGTGLMLIFIKSLVICVSWILGYKAVEQLSVSLYGILDMSRMVFTMLLSVIFLGEVLSAWQIAGLIIVCAGMLLLRLRNTERISSDKTGKSVALFVFMAFGSNFLNAVSSTLDKHIMKLPDMTSTTLQFWYMFFLTCLYFLYIFVTRTKIRWKSALTNKWIYILSIVFVVADKALFIANGMDNTVVGMTLVKQACCIVTILGGKIFFKEKNIPYKLLCAAIVITGIVISVL